MEVLDTFDYEATLSDCAAGKRAALIALYDQEASRLLTVCMRILQNRALAEDVVHDAFIKIWTRASAYNPELGSARGWIYTLTRNLALNAVKYARREVKSEPNFLFDLIEKNHLEPEHNTDSIAEMAQDSLAQKQLLACIDHLPPESKLCILHAYVDGYTQDEISGLLDKPLGTVKSWLKRSLASLKECLQ